MRPRRRYYRAGQHRSPATGGRRHQHGPPAGAAGRCSVWTPHRGRRAVPDACPPTRAGTRPGPGTRRCGPGPGTRCGPARPTAPGIPSGPAPRAGPGRASRRERTPGTRPGPWVRAGPGTARRPGIPGGPCHRGRRSAPAADRGPGHAGPPASSRPPQRAAPGPSCDRASARSGRGTGHCWLGHLPTCGSGHRVGPHLRNRPRSGPVRTHRCSREDPARGIPAPARTGPRIGAVRPGARTAGRCTHEPEHPGRPTHRARHDRGTGHPATGCRTVALPVRSQVPSRHPPVGAAPARTAAGSTRDPGTAPRPQVCPGRCAAPPGRRFPEHPPDRPRARAGPRRPDPRPAAAGPRPARSPSDAAGTPGHPTADRRPAARRPAERCPAARRSPAGPCVPLRRGRRHRTSRSRIASRAPTHPGNAVGTVRRRRPRSLSVLLEPVGKMREGAALGATPSHEDVRRRPALPRSLPRSTIGSERLSFRVRNGTGRFPLDMTAETLLRCGRSRPNLGNRTVDASRKLVGVVKPSAY